MHDWPGVELPPSACPCCGKNLDAATGAMPEGRQLPEPGDLSICIYCGTWLRFNEQLTLVELSTDEIAQLSDDVRNLLLRMRHQLAIYRRVIK